MRLAAPEALGERHLVGEFDCGEASLNDWLKRRAGRNFYLRPGLEPSPLEPLTLMTTVADLRAALGN